MNQLPAIAHKYHETLESFRTFRGIGFRLLAGIFVAGLVFAALLARLVLTTAQHRGAVHYVEIAFTFIGEMIFLLFLFRVQHARDQEAIRRVNALVYGEAPATTIRQARSTLLAFLFAQPPTAFLAVADNVRKCLDLSSGTNRGFNFRAEDVLHFIFHPEARTRIVSLSLALATLITGLTLLNSEAREVALEIVVALKTQWLALWLTGVVVLVGLYFALAVFFTGGRAICEYVSRRSSDEKEMNPALIRYLLRDLATYHVWPGPALVAPSITLPIQKTESNDETSPAFPEPEPPLTTPVTRVAPALHP